MSTLTVVIPARNEEGRIVPAVRAVHATLADAGIGHEMIVVDDGSVDRTFAEAVELVPAYPLRVVRHAAALGKGGAIASGFRAAQGDFAGFIDADLEFPPQTLVALWREIQARPRPDLCCAVGERHEDERRFLERLSSRLAHLAIRLALRLPLRDTQAGVKIFPGWFARETLSNPTQNGWMFDVEALLQARAAGLQIVSLPLRQARSRARRAGTAEYLQCALILARLAAATRGAPEAAATRLD